MHSVQTWTHGTRREAVDRLTPLLAARVTAGTTPKDPALGPVIRRYKLGSAPLVRDRRSGRSTGRLDRVLAGDLDAFLPEPSAHSEPNPRRGHMSRALTDFEVLTFDCYGTLIDLGSGHLGCTPAPVDDPSRERRLPR